jgi:hypothetical protein
MTGQMSYAIASNIAREAGSLASIMATSLRKRVRLYVDDSGSVLVTPIDKVRGELESAMVGAYAIGTDPDFIASQVRAHLGFER